MRRSSQILKNASSTTVLEHSIGPSIPWPLFEKELFRWIADINENESLVRVLPTNVVYIRNIKLGSLTPFVTEHNSVYVYNEKTGKIEEVFE